MQLLTTGASMPGDFLLAFLRAAERGKHNKNPELIFSQKSCMYVTVYVCLYVRTYIYIYHTSMISQWG